MRTRRPARLPDDGPDPEGDVPDDQVQRPPGFVRRTVVLEPGASRASDDAEWHDALVLLVQGDVELECSAGGRRRFRAGAVLWLSGIELRALHNVGVDVAVLLAVSRRS